MPVSQSTPSPIACDLILDELQRTLQAVSDDEVQTALRSILSAHRIFFMGAGRSGLALRMAAMRMMHLGLTVFVAGEVVTPAIERGDLLIVASGSGSTSGPLHAAEVARAAGAEVLAITAVPDSALGRLSSAVLQIPAATKQAHGGTISQQYAGSLFEQATLLVLDALFQQLWQQRGESAQELWKRHANLE